jgi:hypothetical protein
VSALTACADCGQGFKQTGSGRPRLRCDTCRRNPLKPKRDTDGSQEWLRELPDAIASCADAGLPVIVDLPPTLSPAHQRLMGTLGVLVRFVQPRTEE